MEFKVFGGRGELGAEVYFLGLECLCSKYQYLLDCPWSIVCSVHSMKHHIPPTKEIGVVYRIPILHGKAPIINY